MLAGDDPDVENAHDIDIDIVETSLGGEHGLAGVRARVAFRGHPVAALSGCRQACRSVDLSDGFLIGSPALAATER